MPPSHEGASGDAAVSALVGTFPGGALGQSQQHGAGDSVPTSAKPGRPGVICCGFWREDFPRPFGFPFQMGGAAPSPRHTRDAKK